MSHLRSLPLVVSGAILPAHLVVAAGAAAGLTRWRGCPCGSGHRQSRRQGHRLLAAADPRGASSDIIIRELPIWAGLRAGSSPAREFRPVTSMPRCVAARAPLACTTSHHPQRRQMMPVRSDDRSGQRVRGYGLTTMPWQRASTASKPYGTLWSGQAPHPQPAESYAADRAEEVHCPKRSKDAPAPTGRRRAAARRAPPQPMRSPAGVEPPFFPPVRPPTRPRRRHRAAALCSCRARQRCAA